ncbi:TonB-dependent receptor [Novosphingobium sp. LASN5T]|nr:TonB-dependent receptor [Novosphingobium sp. LASN5T]
MGTNNMRGAGRLAIAIAGLTAGTHAMAQEAPQNQGFGDIVVTAQRRQENLQNVPIQVAAFSEQKITDAGIKSTREFVNLVPNVSFDESFTYLNSFVVVRGVTQINNADSPVAVIVDGVPQNSQKQLRMNLFDIQRIEVLKGPQGGLYGRNAIGGAMNIITKDPSDHMEGALDASYGRGDAIDVTGSLSTPIGDDAGLRVAGSYKTDNGRIRNTYSNKNVDFIDHDWELRGKFKASLSDNLKIDLRASYRDFRAGAIYDSRVPSGLANDFRLPSSNIEGLTFGNLFDTSAKIDLDLGAATLTSITAYTDIKESYRGDLDFGNPVDNPGGFLGFGIQAGQGQDLRVKLTSQELRLVSNGKGPFRWILGGYYLHTKRSLLTRAFIDLNGSRDQIDNPALALIRLSEDNSNNAYAVYGNVDYDLSDHLTLSGALRYDRDERRQTDLASGAVRKTSFDNVQPKATLTYKFNDRQLVYATYSTGFRSGGFNAPTVSIPVFRAEKLANYEAGFKTSWFDRRLILNGAVYKAVSKDFQYFYIDVATASQIIGNIDKVHIWGVELEMQALPTKGLQLFGAIGTTDTNIRKNVVDPASVGNHTPKTTTWSMNAGFQYNRPLTDDFGLLLRLDYAHKGRKYWQVDNRQVQNPINLVDVRVGVENERWGLYFSGRNIFNEKYYSDYNPKAYSGSDTDIGFRAQPATWAVEAKVKF